MTTVTASNVFDGIATDSFSAATLNTYAISSTSTTSFTLTDPSPTVYDLQIVFTGTDFTGYTGNFANNGTVVSAEIRYWNGSSFVKCADWTGINALANDLRGAIQGSNTILLRSLLFGGADTMNGADSYADSLSGFDGADTLNGNGGNDQLRGLEGNDIVHGGAGNDNVYSEYDVDQVFGDAGDDSIWATNSNAGNGYDGGDNDAGGDTLYAWGLTDTATIDLRDSSVNHMEHIAFAPAQTDFHNLTLYLLGAQAVEFAVAANVSGSLYTNDALFITDIDGMAGTFDISDWVFGSWNTGGTTDSIHLRAAAGGGVIYGSSTQSNTIIGGDGVNAIYGGSAVDYLYGSFDAGDGDQDNLHGGDGGDQYAIYDAADRVYEDESGTGVDYAAVLANNYEVALNLEVVSLFGTAVRALGNDQVNTINGNNTLADELYGQGGNDFLFGQVGNDVLLGGAGADTLDGGIGIDTASYITVSAGVTINLATGAASGDEATGDTLTSIENLIGGGFNDTLTGDAGANRLDGSFGDDILNGGVGADTMIGGGGDDTFYVNVTGDKTMESANGGTDTVRASVTRALNANVENLILTGANAIDGAGNILANALTGNTNANVLDGAQGADKLKGLGGADTLIGGIGNDTLTGGDGADKFVFNVAATVGNADRIIDFTHSSDTIQLDNAIFAALGANALNLAAAKFWVGTDAHDRTDRVIYDNSTGKLYYDADGNAAGAKVLIATLDAHLTLTASDFQVI